MVCNQSHGMQSKIKFPEKMRLKLYRSTFLQNINVLIVNTVQLNDFRSDQSTRFGRPQIITRISRLAGLGVKDIGIRLAFTRLAGLAVKDFGIRLAFTRLAGLAVKNPGIRLAFTLFDHYIEEYTALAEHHQTPKMK